MKNSSRLIVATVLVHDSRGFPCQFMPLRGKYKNGTKVATKIADKSGRVTFLIARDSPYEIYSMNPAGGFEYNTLAHTGAGHKTVIRLNFLRSEFAATTEFRVEDLDGSAVPNAAFSRLMNGQISKLKTGPDGKSLIKSLLGQPVIIGLLKPDGEPVPGAEYAFSAKHHKNGRFRLVLPIKQAAGSSASGEPVEIVSPPAPCPKPDCEELFNKVAPIILRHEGGWVNDPNDSGGATNMGITIGTFRDYAQSDLGIEPTLENLRMLTKEQATKIYRKRYWEPRGYCELNSLKVALMIYDWSITSGGALAQVNKLLREHYGLNPSRKLDSSVINSVANQQDLLERISEIRRAYYTGLAINNGAKTKNFKFLKGWLNRVNDCLLINLR
jgi:lysozyme family protein